ncbi:MAG TPA: hypothetical protein VFL64_05995 [Rhizobacter sp.]|nr:hypothetical protein [Rhizobacter sp.]
MLSLVTYPEIGLAAARVSLRSIVEPDIVYASSRSSDTPTSICDA